MCTNMEQGGEQFSLQLQNSDGSTSSSSVHVTETRELLFRQMLVGIKDGRFDEWTSLISEIEKKHPENIEKLGLVYEPFLSEFPLCYGYWRKYASHKIRLCTIDKAVEVFERSVQSAPFSIGAWADYCGFCVAAFEDSSDIRRLFKRAMSYVGKDYLSPVLWDKYIEFELSHQQWDSLAYIYIQTLQFPTKKLHRYYDSFKKLADIWEEEMKCHNSSTLEVQREPDDEGSACHKPGDVLQAIEDMNSPVASMRHKALLKYISVGEKLYREACKLDEKIKLYEMNIRRSYFHVKPLDVNQLENWHNYLDFAEQQGEFDWAVKLYERCLIPCANYPEFWMRYVEYMEKKGGREVANFSLERATQIFLKRVPVIHLFNARYRECIGDIFGSRASLLQCDQDLDSEFVQNVVITANMERRQGNFTSATSVYKEALKFAELNKKSHTLPVLYVHFSRLQFMITDSADAARNVLSEGIRHVPSSKLLLEELIKLSMLHGGSRHISEVESIVASSISPSPCTSQPLNTNDAEDISNLFMEFVDLCGSVHDVIKAWLRHIKLFPHCVRSTLYNNQNASAKPKKLATEPSQQTLAALLLRSPEDSKLRVQSPIQEEVPPSSENHVSSSDHDICQKFVQSSPKSKNHEVEFEAGAVNPPISSELEKLGEPVQSPEGFLENDNIQHEYNNESCERPVSLENLCLVDTQSEKSRDLIPKESTECEAIVETSFFKGKNENSKSPQGNNIPDESLTKIGENNSDLLLSIPNSADVANSSKILSGAEQTNPCGGGYRHPNRHADRMSRRDSRYGFHGNSRGRFHQQASSRKQYMRTEMGNQVPYSQNQDAQMLSPQTFLVQQDSQAQVATTGPADVILPKMWPTQNVQQQNFTSANQTQPHMAPCTSDSNEQHSDMQTNQAYNDQLWQYYYYQQQYYLQQQYQQQMSQLQQQYLHQQQHQSSDQQPDQQFLQQQQQWQLQYQQQFMQMQQLYPYQMQQQQMGYMQQQQMEIQQSQTQSSEQQVQSYQQQWQEHAEQQCGKEALHRNITSGQSHSCKQEAPPLGSRKHVPSQRSSQQKAALCVTSPDKHHETPQTR